MGIKTIATVAAIAMAAATSAASAGDQFSALEGVSAEPLSSVEMAAVVGATGQLLVTPSGAIVANFIAALLPCVAEIGFAEVADPRSGGHVEFQDVD